MERIHTAKEGGVARCPCGCPGTVKHPFTYASRACGNRVRKLRRLGLLPARPPRICAWCEKNEVKRRGKVYCSRHCAGQAAAGMRSRDDHQAFAQRLVKLNRERYYARVRAEVAGICREYAPDLPPEVFDVAVRIALRVWTKGYRSGWAADYMRKRRKRMAA